MRNSPMGDDQVSPAGLSGGESTAVSSESPVAGIHPVNIDNNNKLMAFLYKVRHEILGMIGITWQLVRMGDCLSCALYEMDQIL